MTRLRRQIRERRAELGRELEALHPSSIEAATLRARIEELERLDDRDPPPEAVEELRGVLLACADLVTVAAVSLADDAKISPAEGRSIALAAGRVIARAASALGRPAAELLPDSPDSVKPD